QHNVEDVDIVLIVCTERYKNLFEKRELPDDGGRGAAWEGAIITNDLYQSLLKNNRFYPIFPDGGDHKHVPVILNDWNNNHRFPSGYDRILGLIRDEIVIPKPDVDFRRLLPGELSGAFDNRLQPREGELFGRSDEVEQVLDFLNSTYSSAAVCGHVSGSGGIGKTEVCKGALKEWLYGEKFTRTFWVQVSDDADCSRFLIHLGKAVDIKPEKLEKIKSVSELRTYLPAGLYYLDNLENVAESEGGHEILRELSVLPGIRLLASSRVSLDGVLGENFSVDRLDKESGLNLFLKCWNGSSEPDREELSSFIDEKLEGHALSISLIARLGRFCSWKKLRERWDEEGTVIAAGRNEDNRLGNLEISFSLTTSHLAEEPGALDLWQFLALFSDGCDEDTLDLWEETSGFPYARRALAEHSLITINDGYC
ncbi:MAG: ATP-binding protein, partial [Desulfobulbaceae bacterium]|nr:ATP-binding protein [Desulfobulbaceae bacterium]